jgi:hypothetical protein
MRGYEIPDGWTHDRGYHLNADGKSIEYVQTENELRAILESINEGSNADIRYYTVIFDTSQGKPWPKVESHQYFVEKDSAKANLVERMEEHA